MQLAQTLAYAQTENKRYVWTWGVPRSLETLAAQKRITLFDIERSGSGHHDSQLRIAQRDQATLVPHFFFSSIAAIGSGCQRLMPRDNIC
jgi:hypothetical protein